MIRYRTRSESPVCDVQYTLQYFSTMEEHLFAERPDTLRQVRACKSCKLLKTAAQFHAHFCDNCSHEHPETQNAAARSDYVETRTTADCELIAVARSLRWQVYIRPCACCLQMTEYAVFSSHKEAGSLHNLT